MHKALKMIKKVLDNCMIRLNLMNELISINRTKLKDQDKRIKSLEFMIDKYITNNDAMPYLEKGTRGSYAHPNDENTKWCRNIHCEKGCPQCAGFKLIEKTRIEEFHAKIDKKYGYDEVEWNRVSGDPYDDDDELVINDPDDGSWAGR